MPIDTEVAPWTEKEIVPSPDDVPQTRDPEPAVKIQAPRPIKFASSRSSLASSDLGLQAPPTPGRRRWDTIRHHVLPGTSSSSDSVPTSPPSETSSIPTRPSTPKLPRFGYKKAFRQVVENVQTQQAGESKRFAEAIRVACWNARFTASARVVHSSEVVGVAGTPGRCPPPCGRSYLGGGPKTNGTSGNSPTVVK